MTTATAEIDPAVLTDQVEVLERPYRMSYETYQQIAELGLIRPEEHVVLLDGMLVQTMTQGSPHFNTVDRGREFLSAAVPQGWYVRADGPIRLRTGPLGSSVPEPDLAIVIGSRVNYESRPPEEPEVGLLVEVASDVDAFLIDRKGLARYAFASIPTVWIVTLYDRKVHIHTEPSGPAANPGYGRVEVRQAGESLEVTLKPPTPDQPPALLGPVAVAAFFPPAP